MRKTTPPLKNYYAILGLPESASLEEVKKAYRKRAFELHPDLNPGAGASRQFQQLNEAYVVLIRLLDKPNQAQPGPEPNPAASKAAHQAYEEQAKREQAQREQFQRDQADRERREKQEQELRERRDAERKARERQENEEKARREDERRQRLREEIERQESERLRRREQARLEKERQDQLREQARQRQEELKREMEQKSPRPEAYKRAYAKPSVAADAFSAGTVNPGAYISDEQNGREALLNDLLNDPFARRVYEDIYSEVQNRRSGQFEEPEKQDAADNPLSEFTKTVGDNFKGWMRSQIDEEQIIPYPAAKLFPGARIRLQIRRGFSREQNTVEVTLPPDFVVGKPIRLRGMGKKLGKWQGDLYLTFQIKN